MHMPISVDKVKTTAFVLRKRLMGYKLLQNPKGTNPNEVTMLKTWFGLVMPEYNDKCYYYKKLHRYKNGEKFVKDETMLMSEYFIDPATKTYSNKRKNVRGYVIKNGECKSLNRTALLQDEIDKRPVPEWHRSGFLDIHSDEYDFRNELQNREKEKAYYLPRPGFFARMVSLGGWREMLGYDDSECPIEPSFLKVLKTNLCGGGVHTKDKESYSNFLQYFKNISLKIDRTFSKK